MENLTLNGKKYVGKSAYINGFNGYTSSDDDGLLCAIINHSCWDKNKKPNILLNSNEDKIVNKNLRGVIIDIK